jgi:sugar phosphate permease
MSVFMLGTFLGSGLAYALGAVAVGLAETRALWEWPLLGTIRPWQSVFLLVGLPGVLVSALMLTVTEPARAVALDGRTVVPLRAVWEFLTREARAVLLLSLGFATFAAVNYGIAAWLATFFVRTHGWTATQAGTLQGLLTMTVGVAGTLLGGVLSDRGVARGRIGAPLTVGLVAAVGMLCTATVYPLVRSVPLVIALLVLVNVFAAMPWGAAQAAIAELFPERMRGQGAAIYLLIVNLLSGVVGPTAVAVMTDRVFGDSTRLGWSLSLTAAVGMSVAALLLLRGRRAYCDALSRPRPN